MSNHNNLTVAQREPRAHLWETEDEEMGLKWLDVCCSVTILWLKWKRICRGPVKLSKWERNLTVVELHYSHFRQDTVIYPADDISVGSFSVTLCLRLTQFERNLFFCLSHLSVLRCGATQGSHICSPAAAPHQRAPLQHPVHHHHTGHADGGGLPVLQHQEPQPQVSFLKHPDIL